jgi:hypothetical protein
MRVRATVNTSGLVRIRARLGRVANADYTPLMQEWRRILEEDNERGLIAGEDAFGRPMQTTQREMGAAKSRRLGTGKPLAPNRSQSRAIKFTQTTYGKDAQGWFALLRWVNFLDRKGRQILGHHKAGIPSKGGHIVRDVVSRPRPNAVRRAKEAARKFVRTLLRKQ